MATRNDIKALRQYPLQIERLKQRIISLRQSMTSIGGMGDGMPHGSNGEDKMAAYVARLDELEREYTAKIMSLEEARKRLDDELDQLDPMEAKMVQMHGIDGKSYIEISHTVHISDRTARRKYNKAVEKLAVNGHILGL